MKLWEQYRDLIDDVDAFRSACLQPLPTAVRVNTIAADPSYALSALEADDVTVEIAPWHSHTFRVDTDSPGTTWAYQHGFVHGQEEISQLPPVVLDPDPGDFVLDLAAAPGGKATQLAAMVRDGGGLVVANDVDLGRIAALRSNADRLGVDNMLVTNQNARTYSVADIDVATFDGTVVDAPCSGEGTVRKNPEMRTLSTPVDRAEFRAIQRDMLTRAVELTAPGGRVVYSTCTFDPAENEGVLSDVLAQSECRLRKIDVALEGRPGITPWQGEEFDPDVQLARRFYPHHTDTGGFFCALLEVTA